MPRRVRRRRTVAGHDTSPGHAPEGEVPGPSAAGAAGTGSAITEARGGPRRREGRVQEEEKKFHVPRRKRDRLVPLKNGRRMDIEDVHDVWHDLQDLRRRHPTHFQALLALGQSQAEDVSRESIAYLQNGAYLSPDGATVRQDVRDVLLSAGPELNDPCQTGGMTDKLKVAMAREERDELFWERMARDLRPGKGGKKGRSPE